MAVANCQLLHGNVVFLTKTTQFKAPFLTFCTKKERNYMENGNIINSVNYPNCDAGVCDTKGRITVCHKNVPAMLNRITNVFSEANINIAHMTNKSRGDYAYCVFDIDSESSKEVADKLSAIDGVLKVRVVK